MNSSLYKEEILEHYKNPSHFGKPEKYDTTSTQLNPFCGDEVSMFVTFVKDNVEEIRFTGKGCALSIAAASMLTEYAEGKSETAIKKFSEEDMVRLLGIEVSETRKKCALLALYTLKDCLK